MRARTVLPLALLALVAVVAAGCGSGEEARPLPQTVEGTIPEQVEPAEPTETGEAPEPTETEDEAAGGEGDPEAGSEVFASAGCGTCHTLADAGTTGTIGPDLDEASPSFEQAVEIVTAGSGAMPSFENQLSEEEIRDVAAYVAQAAGG